MEKKMNETPSVVIFIVEGPSDEDALYPTLELIGEKLNITFEVTRGDSLYAKSNRRKLGTTIIEEIIDDVIKENSFLISDIAMVIQLIDTDGVFVNHNSISIKSSINKIEYSEEEINVVDYDHKEDIKGRNIKRGLKINELISKDKIKNLKYKMLYFSRNLDHVIHNDPDVPDNEKITKADGFASNYYEPDDFIKFFSDNDFTVEGDYIQTWEFIKRKSNSLKKYSNFYLVFDILRVLNESD